MNNILTKEIWINTSIDSAFDCFTKSEAMLAWHGKEIELDPVPGGIYKVVFEDGTVILGAYKEVEQNKRVVYTAKYGNVESLIKVTFAEEDGGVRVKIKQEFSPDQDTSSFNEGWDYFLGLLRELLESKK